MISRAVLRSIFRWVHLILAIPILGYVYAPASEAQQYAPAVRWVFVPVSILAGYWMYAGWAFALIGVGLWLGAIRVSGVGPAIFSQVALFVARKILLVISARRRK